MRDILQSRYLRSNVAHKQLARTSLNFIRGNENVTHSVQGEKAFLGGVFCLEYPSRRSEKRNVYFANYRFSFHKLQIFISQTTDFQFANFRFSFRFVSFRFVWFRFAKYNRPSTSSNQRTIRKCRGQVHYT